MKRMMSLAVIGAVATTLSATGPARAEPVTQSAVAATCPSGAVCLQEPDGSIARRNIWYSYGPHNLSNVIGIKILINSQTGGAGFQICKGYNGTDCYPVLRGVGAYAPYDFTPINSIVLVR
ncbi:hypothetical protein [Nonomuraea endophytica]|uniref:Peptidase inhibitor family I36 protein n=1 Tax=Nonomuraea endophytica TaxID=714136 RepID=A0A7W8A496_9ACTN|nr:hypothetical protein [Nonomuraea endophytica]MBB5079260.1 hypothetical protein [Nonomuraea endophytica]